MTRKDLPLILQQAYDALPSERQKEEFLNYHDSLRKQMVRGAVSQIQNRNFSHNVGAHIKGIKK